MVFNTPVIPDISIYPIQYHHKILMMGSCFAEHIGLKLKDAKLSVTLNPMGILFNPESIARCIDFISHATPFTQNNLIYNQGLWSSLDHHGIFSNVDAEICLKNINANIETAHQKLNQADYIILTFGTAWVYRYKPTNEIVANCHKLPGSLFTRERLCVDEITSRYSEIIEKISVTNKNIHFIFTVSPIRHLRDGAVDNQVSKSTLILAIHQLQNKYTNVHYFPSYEIMMDDLRDYRYYNEDMVHPSPLAIEYIWEQFLKSWIDKKAIKTIEEIYKIRTAMSHQPLQPGSESFKKFVSQQLQIISDLTHKYPGLDFTEEKNYFNSLTY